MGKVRGKIVWFTGLSGAGKTTLCVHLAAELARLGKSVQILDGDDIRRGLSPDLTFSEADRTENVRRTIYVADILARTGCIVLVSLITPFHRLREMARSQLPDLLEVFVDAPLSICEERDPKGLYRRARAGELKEFTGIDSPFEIPSTADLVCHTDRDSIEDCISKLLDAIMTADAIHL